MGTNQAMSNAETADLLRRAAEYLEQPIRWMVGANSDTVSFSNHTYQTVTTATATTTIPGQIMYARLARMFRETAAEFDEPNVGIGCGHCWDNVALARMVLGMEPDEFGAGDVQG